MHPLLSCLSYRAGPWSSVRTEASPKLKPFQMINHFVFFHPFFFLPCSPDARHVHMVW